MKISANKERPGYTDLYWRITVLFNGVKLCDAVFADDEAGLIERIKVDSLGNFEIKNGEIQTYIEYGKVEIVIPEELSGYFTACNDEKKAASPFGQFTDRLFYENQKVVYNRRSFHCKRRK